MVWGVQNSGMTKNQPGNGRGHNKQTGSKYQVGKKLKY